MKRPVTAIAGTRDFVKRLGVLGNVCESCDYTRVFLCKEKNPSISKAKHYDVLLKVQTTENKRNITWGLLLFLNLPWL